MQAATVSAGHERIRRDLEEQLPFAERDLRSIAGAKLFITGGTGFVGRWLLESLVYANERLGTNIHAVVLTRTPLHFRTRFPHLAEHPCITLLEGDVRAGTPAGVFDGCIHAATPASAALNRDAPLEMLSTIVDGGEAILKAVSASGRIPFLLTSTGAIYGPQPAELDFIPENYGGGPDCLQPRFAYAEGKRVAELQSAVYAQTHGLDVKIARLFAFVGPYLPLDIHFAIGNFIGDVLAGRPIVLTGDGSTVRSYQYAAELVTWLWAIYARGTTLRPYNVGSTEAISTGELARTVATFGAEPVGVEIRGIRDARVPVDRYVPDTRRIREELGVVQSITMRTAIERTFAFHRANNG